MESHCLILRHVYVRGILKPERRHVDAVPNNDWGWAEAYAQGMPADYATDVLGGRTPWIALVDAYKHGALAPDLDLHFADLPTSTQRAHALAAAYEGGLDFADSHLAKFVDNEADRAIVLEAAFRCSGVPADFARHVAPFKRSTPRARVLQAAYRHGGLAPDFERHIDCIEHEGDRATALAAAYSSGRLPPDYDRHILSIEDSTARALVLAAAFRNGLAPDYSAHVAPLAQRRDEYVDALCAAYDGGLTPDFDAHVSRIHSVTPQDVPLILSHAYRAGLPPDYEAHLQPCRSAGSLMWEDALMQAYRTGLVAPDAAHLVYCWSSKVLLTAIEHGLEPDVRHIMIHVPPNRAKLALCALYDAGHVVPDYDAHIRMFASSFDRAWVLDHAYLAGLVADFDAHIAPLNSDNVRFLALASAYKHGGLAPDTGRDLAAFTDPAIRELVLSLLEQDAAARLAAFKEHLRTTPYRGRTGYVGVAWPGLSADSVNQALAAFQVEADALLLSISAALNPVPCELRAKIVRLVAAEEGRAYLRGV